ncbi:MAG: hypothetical protein WA647_21225 [Candidatus Acidiferrum sp.]
MSTQRACTLTFKLSDASTKTIALPANAPVTPSQVIAHIKADGGVWAGGMYTPGAADTTGVAVGSVWVNWEQVVSVTIS